MTQGNLVLERLVVPLSRTRTASGMISAGHEKVKGRLRSLAEAVILQAMEDLFDPSEREASIVFFKGEDFRSCAEAAGLSTLEQKRIIRMLGNTAFI